MTDTQRPIGRRARLLVGLGVVAASLLAATVVAGVGFAGGSISASQYQYGKVTICHHTHSKKHPYVTLKVSQAAWPAHQRHGDTLGACAGSAPTHHGKENHHAKSHDGQVSSSGTADSSSTTSTASSPSHGNDGGDSGHGGSGHGGSGHGHK